ncbi:hypothetical protein ACSBR2_040497 [Camellia fascicularis]
MEVVLLMICTYGQTNAVVRIHDDFTFAGLVDVVCEKFGISSPALVFLLFVIPGYNKFKKRSSGSNIEKGVADCNSVDVFDIDDGLTYGMEDRTDLLPLYCPHNSKTFLSAGWAYGITHVGQIFLASANEFWTVLCKFAVECGFQFKYVKNDSVRITAVCKFATSTGCAWLVHARVSASNEVFCLKRFVNLHSCGAAVRTYRNPRTGSDLVIAYRVAWLDVEKARGEVYGDHAISFDQLRWYSNAVIENNPRSYINLDFDQQTGSGYRYGEMCSNASESFNNWIRTARHLPITQLVDAIRGQLMEQMAKRKAKCSVWRGELCPQMATTLELVFKTSRSWIVSQANENVFEVRSRPSVLVDIGACSCFQWQLNGFPCPHAVVAFRNSGRNIYDHVVPFYRVTEFRAAYSGTIHPIPTARKPNFLVADYLIALSTVKRPPGRPKRKRIPSKDEVVPCIRCGRCGKMGNHNRKTCKEPM